MWLIFQDKYSVEIDDKYVSNSPYLSTLMNSQNTIDKYVENDTTYYIISDDWIDPDDFVAYTRLISGDIVYVSQELLDFMGHENPLQYPPEFHIIKIHDNWVRNNFYKLPEILEDPLYDLEEVPLNQDRVSKVLEMLSTDALNIEGIYICGGAAMYMGDIINDHRDIDFFTTNTKNLLNLVRSGIRYYSGSYLRDNCIEVGIHVHQSSDNDDVNTYSSTGTGSMQFILRKYQTPSEIVHGFDLDCCGYVYDMKNNKLYRTQRAKYSTMNKKNYFDPDRSSPSYSVRLSKYNLRGFDIWIPYLDRILFNDDLYNDYCLKIVEFTNTMYEYHEDTIYKVLEDVPFEVTQQDLDIIKKIKESGYVQTRHMGVFNQVYYEAKKLSTTGIPDFLRFFKINVFRDANNIINTTLPHDPASILALSISKRLHISSEDTKGDYDKYNDNNPELILGDIRDEDIVWKTNNPMEQLSGTFYPEPIMGDILEWYSRSPFMVIIQQD